MKNSRLDAPVREEGSKAGGKAPYAKPVLKVFGSVKSLTRANGGSQFDMNNRAIGKAEARPAEV
jgi:hypothetical protein